MRPWSLVADAGPAHPKGRRMHRLRGTPGRSRHEACPRGRFDGDRAGQARPRRAARGRFSRAARSPRGARNGGFAPHPAPPRQPPAAPGPAPATNRRPRRTRRTEPRNTCSRLLSLENQHDEGTRTIPPTPRRDDSPDHTTASRGRGPRASTGTTRTCDTAPRTAETRNTYGMRIAPTSPGVTTRFSDQVPRTVSRYLCRGARPGLAGRRRRRHPASGPAAPCRSCTTVRA
jgi:hypothetical protein